MEPNWFRLNEFSATASWKKLIELIGWARDGCYAKPMENCQRTVSACDCKRFISVADWNFSHSSEASTARKSLFANWIVAKNGSTLFLSLVTRIDSWTSLSPVQIASLFRPECAEVKVFMINIHLALFHSTRTFVLFFLPFSSCLNSGRTKATPWM